MDARDEIAKVAAEYGWKLTDTSDATLVVIEFYEKRGYRIRLRFRWYGVPSFGPRQGFGVESARVTHRDRIVREFIGRHKRRQVVDYLRGINALPSG